MIKMLFSMLVLVLSVCFLSSGAMGQGASGLRGAELGDRVEKRPIKTKVLQVLEKGLLMSGSLRGSPYLIAGYPDFREMADGERINCYVVKTKHTYKYTDSRGVVRTVRVWRFAGKRLGG